MINLASLGCAAAALALMSTAGRAETPQYLYGASAASTGPVTVTATTGTMDNPRAAYVVATTADATRGLKVTAWQDTTHKLLLLGDVDVGGAVVAQVAATGLDPSHVVTADINVQNRLSIRTWALGGAAGISEANVLHVANGGYPNSATTPTLGIASLSATQVVTALQDVNGNLEVEEWTVGTGSAAATPVGVIWNGGAVSEVAIAELDSATVIVAASLPDDNDLEITTLGIDSAGVHYQDQYVLKGIAGGGLYPSIAIGAGTEVTSTVVDGLPSLKIVRSAFTPIVTSGNTIDVIDWSISQTGKISLVRQKGNDDDYSFATAACMLPTLVPISAYYDQSGVNSIVNVGWYEEGMETDFIAVSGLGTTVGTLSAANSGTSFNVLNPNADYNAYFVTGTQTYSGTELDGKVQIRMWSYQVTPPL
jgi:hypothetical protein